MEVGLSHQPKNFQTAGSIKPGIQEVFNKCLMSGK